MLRLSNLSIGTKLIVTSLLGIMLMAGMIATMLMGNSQVRLAVDDAGTQGNLSEAAAEARSSIRGLQIGLRRLAEGDGLFSRTPEVSKRDF
jgi:hypothetical protein